MKKLDSFKNTIILFDFFINNALKGMLSRGILKNRKVQLTLVTVVIFAYISFFMYNFNQLNDIMPENLNISETLLLDSKKQTIFSFLSVVIYMSIIISIFVNNSLSLDKTSLFFAKLLPFSKSEVKFAYLFFKFSLMIILFGIFNIILFLAIQLITDNKFEYIIFFISLHLVFFIIALLYEILKNIILIFPKSIQKSFDIYVDYIILTVSVVYFLQFRYAIEVSLAKTSLSIRELIYISFFSSIIILLIMILLLIFVPSSDKINRQNNFYKINFLKNPILRYRPNQNLIFFSFIFLIIILLQSGFLSVLNTIPSIVFFSCFLLIPYADIISDFRKLFGLLRISVLDEWFRHFRIVLFLTLLYITSYLFSVKSNNDIYHFVILAFSAITLGYLFQKSKGSINEINASILLTMIFVLIFLININIYIELLLIFVSMVVNYIVLKEINNENLK